MHQSSLPRTNTDSTFRIATVCDGNICRSPFAASLLETYLQHHCFPITTESMGLHAVEGAPMEPQMAVRCAHHGGAVHHVAQQATRDLADDVHLLLAMTKRQRDEVVQLSPKSMRKAFTISEFAFLSEGIAENDLISSDALMSCIRSLSNRRSLIQLGKAHDVPDPFRQEPEVFEAVASTLVTLCRRIADNLTPNASKQQ